jgi:hypothetical protein
LEQTDQLAPLCFVRMPFGKKMDAAGRVANFDSVYEKIIAPAIAEPGSSRSAPTRRRSAAPSISRWLGARRTR